MSCTNCFGGCVETTSDKCVKYTGSPITFLNIHTGDSLEAVEKAITDYLTTVLSGIGILPVIEPTLICDTVKQYFPCEECGSPTLIDILTAIIQAICAIEVEIAVERGRIDAIEADYTVGCLRAAPRDGTHVILQEVITTLCTAICAIETLNNLFTTCVTIGTTNNINTLIQNYLNTITTDNKMYTKMVPYVIYPFYPTNEILSPFTINGAGIVGSTWEKIYFCNGDNNTPDLRGRSLIGVAIAMGAGSFNPEVDPANGNPNYVLTDKAGANSVSLTTPQIPAHSHVATVAINDLGHQSSIMFRTSNPGVLGGGASYEVESINDNPYNTGGRAYTGKTSSELDKTGITATATNANTGGGEVHDNVHPVHACYYIMYIPI